MSSVRFLRRAEFVENLASAVHSGLSRECANHEVVPIRALKGLIRNDLRVSPAQTRDGFAKSADRRYVVAKYVQGCFEHRDPDVLSIWICTARLQGGKNGGKREKPSAKVTDGRSYPHRTAADLAAHAHQTEQ
jgi:hypothetical protein